MLTLMTKGGLLMWVILFNGLLALVILLERLFHLHRAKIHTRDFITGIINILKRGNVMESIALCDETSGPVAQVVKTAVMNHDRGREEIREAMEDAARAEVARLERRLPVLATVAQVTPLIGFLGTVTGMIKIFMVIQTTQLATPGQLAGGVWEALLTTAGGLVIAIPAYVAYNYLVGRVQNLVLDMECAANEILNFLSRHKAGTTADPTVAMSASERNSS